MSKEKHRKPEHHQPSLQGGQPAEQRARAPEEGVSEAAGAAGQPAVPDVAALRAECDDLLARLQRVSADYLNYQKRAAREIAEAREFANSGLIKDLLAVLDDLERAVAAAEARRGEAAGAGEPLRLEEDSLLAGVRLVHEKALTVLACYGLKSILAEGQPFDPLRHQALSQEPSAEHARPTVLRQLQRGYEMKGRVLRPASVVVSTPVPPAQDKGQQPDPQEKTEERQGEAAEEGE